MRLVKCEFVKTFTSRMPNYTGGTYRDSKNCIFAPKPSLSSPDLPSSPGIKNPRSADLIFEILDNLIPNSNHADPTHISKPTTTTKMSARDTYQPPSGSATNIFAQAGAEGPTTTYMCGDCATKVPLKKGDPIRCKECGHRVLYKERTRRYVIFCAFDYDG